jgi:hypothetical protein
MNTPRVRNSFKRFIEHGFYISEIIDAAVELKHHTVLCC